MANDPNQNVSNSAAGPASVSVDGQTTTEHPLGAQVQAARFLMATRARSKGPLAGVTFGKLRAPGAVLPACPTDGYRGPNGL